MHSTPLCLQNPYSIDIEGTHFGIPTAHGRAEELEDRGPVNVPAGAEDKGEAKCQRLIAELVAARQN